MLLCSERGQSWFWAICTSLTTTGPTRAFVLARIRRVTVSAWPPLSTAAGIEIAAYPTFVERMNAAGVQIFLQ